MFTTFSQQILSGKLLLAIKIEQRINFSNGFKLVSITTYHLAFIIKLCKNVVVVQLFKKFNE